MAPLDQSSRTPLPRDQALTVEHEVLRKQVEELRREHVQLTKQHPVDIPAHKAHRLKLRTKIDELRAHRERLAARQRP